MKKRIILSVIWVLLCLYFVTLFYKTICVMLLFLTWQGWLRTQLPARVKPWGIKAAWAVLALTLWWGTPDYLNLFRTPRVRLLYLNDEGLMKRPPLSHYVLNTFVPEEEAVNFGLTNLTILQPILRYAGIGGRMVRQAQDDRKAGKIGNFLYPYKHLGGGNPMSGAYAQCFNATFGEHNRVVYFQEPRNRKCSNAYPLVVFCHGYLGNWKLYQGIWSGLNNAYVLSISTLGLDGIFSPSDLRSIFDFYISSLEQMGYHVDRQQVHLIGLSNGGTAIISAMNSPYAKRFKSITTVSANLAGLRRVPCQVNLIGGGKDSSATLLPSQYRKLKSMGVDAALLFDENENHFFAVNKREEMLDFLQKRMDLKPVPTGYPAEEIE